MSEQKKIESQFVDYETAKMLRELNFDEHCFGYYFKVKSKEDGEIKYQNDPSPRNELFYNLKTHCLTPLWQQVEQWLWEKKKIVVRIEQLGNHWLWIRIEPKTIPLCCLDKYDSPITAKTEGIKQAIKHLHSKK